MKTLTRATATEFEAWKARCIADPAQLDELPKSVQDYWRKEWNIAPVVKVAPRVTTSISDNGLHLRLQLLEDATFHEIAVFTNQIVLFMAVIPTDDFHALLRKAQSAMAPLGVTWNQIFSYLKEGAA